MERLNESRAQVYPGTNAGKKKRQRVTIVDVAEAAGVSKTTISRYINGKYEYMSDESKERIGKIIEELGYRPNKLARGLKMRESRVIGVIVADLTSPFSPIMLKGINDCCERYGYRILIANSDNSSRKEREYVMHMADQQVDGIILNTTGYNMDFLARFHEDTGMNFVLADRPLRRRVFDIVRSDDRKAIVDALKYMRTSGYETVGLFVYELRKSSTRIHRCKIFKEAYREIFPGEPQICSFKGDMTDDAVLERFLGAHAGRRTGILTVNGEVTMRLIKSMLSLGLDFPRDCGVCSFDDWDWMSLVGGGLTAVAQPTYLMGRECVKRMMYRLHRNKHAAPKVLELPCELIERHST